MGRNLILDSMETAIPDCQSPEQSRQSWDADVDILPLRPWRARSPRNRWRRSPQARRHSGRGIRPRTPSRLSTGALAPIASWPMDAAPSRASSLRARRSDSPARATKSTTGAMPRPTVRQNALTSGMFHPIGEPKSARPNSWNKRSISRRMRSSAGTLVSTGPGASLPTGRVIASGIFQTLVIMPSVIHEGWLGCQRPMPQTLSLATLAKYRTDRARLKAFHPQSSNSRSRA